MKDFKTIEDQIKILESRNINIPNLDLAKNVLEYDNYYYVINGYKAPFIATTSRTDVYKSGVSFNEIYALYSFDRKLRELLLTEILRVEHMISSKIITVFSKYHGQDHTSYLLPNSFNINGFENFKRTNNFIHEMIRLLDKKKLNPQINHYLSNYGFVPLWVLSTVFNFGHLTSLYSCMLANEKQEIASEFNLTSNEFKALISYVGLFRNKCAHGDRIYCHKKTEDNRKNPISIPHLHIMDLMNIPKNTKGYKYGTRDILALLISLKYFMHPNRYRKLLKHIDYALNTKLKNSLASIPVEDISAVMGLNCPWMILKYL